MEIFKEDMTGTHSYFTNFKGVEIMFHVVTQLPFRDQDEQQIDRKRHIGNDVLIIIFKEGNEPFDPTLITSRFNHVFVVIQKISNEPETTYKMAVASKQGVSSSTPALIDPPIFKKSEEFRDFLLTKCK